MKSFSYRALDGAGLIRQGTIAAANPADLDVRLRRANLDLISCNRAWFATIPRDKSWTRRELIDFTFHLEQMHTAGVPLLEALCEYRDAAEKPTLNAVATKLIDSIDSGKSLSEACAVHPDIFNQLFVSMLAVGEKSGCLDQVLTDLGELLNWQDETMSRVSKIMVYPSFVAIVLTVVIVFVMTWLVPGLMSFVMSTGNELPWHTRALVATSGFVSGYWVYVCALVAGAAVLINFLVATNLKARTRWHSLLLRAPLIGPVLFKIKLARFSRCASLMYSSGISLVETLRLSEKVVDNLVLADELRKIRLRIIEGEAVSGSFSMSPVFPPMFSRMMRVGESTGAMDIAFNQTGYYYDRESRGSIDRLEQFIGPCMIMIVGSVMMWVVISVIGPIYDLVFSMSGQL